MDEVLQKLFSGERILQNFGLMFLKFGGVRNSGSRAEEGSGEESARGFGFEKSAGLMSGFKKSEECDKLR